MNKNIETSIKIGKWSYNHWRLWTGIVLWLISVFSLAVAAEGINKNQWIMIGMVPITLLAIGFVFPRRVHIASEVLPVSDARLESEVRLEKEVRPVSELQPVRER